LADNGKRGGNWVGLGREGAILTKIFFWVHKEGKKGKKNQGGRKNLKGVGKETKRGGEKTSKNGEGGLVKWPLGEKHRHNLKCWEERQVEDWKKRNKKFH